MSARYPERIVCLTEETTETLYLLGEERRIVGISGYTVRPPRARREKPRVSAFLSARIDKILELKPDLVLGFSDLQADIARDLAKAGLNIMIFNQRSVGEILSMIQMLASLVGAPEKGAALIQRLETGLREVSENAWENPRWPKAAQDGHLATLGFHGDFAPFSPKMANSITPSRRRASNRARRRATCRAGRAAPNRSRHGAYGRRRR